MIWTHGDTAYLRCPFTGMLRGCLIVVEVNTLAGTAVVRATTPIVSWLGVSEATYPDQPTYPTVTIQTGGTFTIALTDLWRGRVHDQAERADHPVSLTQDELAIVKLLNEALDRFGVLPRYHEANWPAFTQTIRAAEHLVTSRLAVRRHPTELPQDLAP